MPTIYLSTNLVSLIGKKRLLPGSHITTDPDPRSSWNGRLFYENKRKCILFTNKATLYNVVRLDILKKDLTDLRSFFLGALFTQLKYDGFYNSQEENYWLENLRNLEFAGTDNDKKVIGSMNDLLYHLKVGFALGSSLMPVINDTNAANYLNTIPMSLIDHQYPRDRFRDVIKKQP